MYKDRVDLNTYESVNITDSPVPPLHNFYKNIGVPHSDYHNKPQDEIERILGHLIERPLLYKARRIASSWGVTVPQALIALEVITAQEYGIALARYFRLPFLRCLDLRCPKLTIPEMQTSKVLSSAMYAEHKKGFDVLCLTSERLTPDSLRQALFSQSNHTPPICITTRKTVQSLIVNSMKPAFTSEAIYGLNFRFPGESAGTRPDLRHYLLPISLVILLIFTVILQPENTLFAGGIILSCMFLSISWFRLLALFRLRRHGIYHEGNDSSHVSDGNLPVYTILIPLFREKNMLLSIVQAAQRLDYPRAKLDIKIILESDDHDCLNAISNFKLPPMFEVVVVPKSLPQTKPKALNYALPFARGEYLAILKNWDGEGSWACKSCLPAFYCQPSSTPSFWAICRCSSEGG